MKKILFLLLLCIVHLAACSSTKVTGVWQDKNYKGPVFKNILVVSLFLDQEVSRMSELQLARQLQQKGVSASSGQVVLPAGSRSSVATITGAIGKHAFDGILISRIVNRLEETRVTAQSACNSRWESDYRQNQRYSLSPCKPGSLSKTTAVYGLETNLYTTKDGALVTSLTSATTADQPSDALIKGFVKSVVERLSGTGLLASQ
jgi:hypothetical protein